MQTITTYNGITLGFDEISRNSNSEGLAHHLKVKGLDKHKIIGTTSTLTNEQVEPFIEDCLSFAKCWKNYNNGRSCYSALESLNSLLEANGIDLTKTYVVLQIKND